MAEYQAHAQIAGDGIDIFRIGKFIFQVLEMLLIQIQRIGPEIMAVLKPADYLENITEHGGILYLLVLLFSSMFCTNILCRQERLPEV